MRVVVDTNIFISGLISPGPSRRILDLIEENSFSCVLTPDLFKELNKTLHRPKFKILFKDININKLMTIVKNNSLYIIPSVKMKACRDPKDDMVLTAAIVAKADMIVSGDKDLLVLNPFEDIAIVTPREFLQRINK